MSFDDKKQNITSIKDVKKREYKTPKCTWDPNIEKEIQTYIKRSLSQSDINIFENISGNFQAFYDRSCTNMSQLKKRTKNESGFIWEHFCLMYLKSKGYGECWLISDTPEKILKKLNLSRMDMGIDIVIKHKNGFFAVHAKWRSNKKKASKISLTWNEDNLKQRIEGFIQYANQTKPETLREKQRRQREDFIKKIIEQESNKQQ